MPSESELHSRQTPSSNPGVGIQTPSVSQQIQMHVPSQRQSEMQTSKEKMICELMPMSSKDIFTDPPESQMTGIITEMKNTSLKNLCERHQQSALTP